MARIQKIDNARRKYVGKEAKKNEKKRMQILFLIVCEGEKTEPNYFFNFPEKEEEVEGIIFKMKIETERGMKSPRHVVEKAIEMKDKFVHARVWAVFDKDDFTPSEFNAAIRRAREHQIGCAWSNEAFELWYLLHFHNRTTPMGREDYKKAIEEAVNKKTKQSQEKETFKYEKNSTRMYALLDKYGNQAQAIQWAKELAVKYKDEKFAEHNPCTHVFELVEELKNGPKSLAEEITKDLR
jgi:hypothetical protein